MQQETILALDVGEKRVGVAIANVGLRFARPLTTLEHDDIFWDNLATICTDNNVVRCIVGLPRGLQGQQTAQTDYVEAFAAELQEYSSLPIVFQDEALTSVKAEAELKNRGKPYEKADIDALAATYILEDYLEGQG